MKVHAATVAYVGALGAAAAAVWAAVAYRNEIAAWWAGLWPSNLWETVNPANPDNALSRTADAAVQFVTGDSTQTAGGAAFDFMNPRAGLADNEISPARGVIISTPTIKSAAPIGPTAEEGAYFFSGDELASGLGVYRPVLKLGIRR